MDIAYVDASGLIAVSFNQPRGPEFERRLTAFTRLVASNFLEAEVSAAFANPERGREYNSAILAGIEWIYPERPLTQEIAATLAVGYLRGADLWHVAVALYAFPEPSEITFLTLDNRQRAVVATLGFRV